MSARGARSRKAVVKNIEKKEKKEIEKSRAASSLSRPDAFAEWPPTSSSSSRDTGAPSRSTPHSTETRSATSRSSSANPGHGKQRLNTIHSNDSFDFKSLHRPKTAASGRSASISESSTQGREKKKYQSKAGKTTKAPRGRGGGVPIKKPVVTAAPPPMPLHRSDTSASRINPNQKTWMDFKIWEGGDSGFPPYGGFDFDEHMQEGNVLVYFKEEQMSEDRPIPQIRCELAVLEHSGSTWLNNALLYGRIDDDEEEWTLASRPESALHPRSSHIPRERRMLGPSSPGGISPPPFNIDQQYFGVPANGTASRAQYYAETDRPGWPQSPPPFQQNEERTPTHELWFTAPPHIRTPQAQRLHHVAIRNFLALLHGKPIVGAELYEMLSTLQPEIQIMYDLDQDHQSRSPRERSVQMITNYLNQRQLDDVRNSIKTALGLLAWSEQDNVKWRQGYLESFVHLAGVMSSHMEDLPDFKRLSIVTRRNLAIAAKSLQLRIMEAEEKLSSFDFSEFWSEGARGVGGAVHQSYMAFRQFLINYFSHTYGNWPPNQSSTWLTRKVVLSLQKDFGSLYDYLVNRDVVWDSREERPGKKWQMVDQKKEDFRADLPDLSLTDMLVTFDNKHGYLHIPHPYPLLPREVPQAKPAAKKSFFSRKPKVDANKDAKAHLQLSIVFSDATNIEKMDVAFNGSPLIDQFERFELSSDLKGVSPREARLGRWLLLYGTLQVLSTLSVDVRDLKWTEGVRYFLCTDLKRCPEWVTNGQLEYLEASQIRSWCWQRPWGPTPIGSPVELDATHSNLVSSSSSPGLGGELDQAERERATRVLNRDIQRIGEKIEGMSVNSRRVYERRIENEKIKREEFDITKRAYSSEREVGAQRTPPMVPVRSPMRSPALSPLGYPEEKGGWL